MGGPTAVLQDYLELPAEVANGIVATSQDMSEAFKRAINWVPEQERAPRVAQMVADVDAKYGAAAKSDHGLDIFRKRAAIVYIDQIR